MHGGVDCCGNLYLIRPMEGNPRQSWILDSRYWIPFFLVELGLWFPMVSGILDSLSCVPNPKGQDFGFHIKITVDSKFHQQIFPGFSYIVYIRNCKGGWGCGPTPPYFFRWYIFFNYILWFPRSVTYHTNKV